MSITLLKKNYAAEVLCFAKRGGFFIGFTITIAFVLILVRQSSFNLAMVQILAMERVEEKIRA